MKYRIYKVLGVAEELVAIVDSLDAVQEWITYTRQTDSWFAYRWESTQQVF